MKIALIQIPAKNFFAFVAPLVATDTLQNGEYDLAIFWSSHDIPAIRYSLNTGIAREVWITSSIKTLRTVTTADSTSITLYLWNHPSNAAFGDNNILKHFNKSSRSGIELSICLYPDGWVGDAWSLDDAINLTSYLEIDPSMMRHVFFKRGAGSQICANKSIDINIPTSEAIAKAAKSLTHSLGYASLDLLNNYAKRLSKDNKSLIVIATRAWCTEWFHHGKYNYHKVSPQASINEITTHLISSIIDQGCDSQQWNVLLCPDSRFVNSLDINSLQSSILQSTRVGECLLSTTMFDMSLSFEFWFPVLMNKITDIWLISFDSNTPVPFFYQNLNFNSLIGCNVDILKRHSWLDAGVKYIETNCNRIRDIAGDNNFICTNSNGQITIKPGSQK